MCDQMIYAEIFHFNCEPHVSGWAWAYIAASDKKKKKKSAVLQTFHFEENTVIKISLFNMGCILQAFTEWSDHGNWRLDSSTPAIKLN